MLAEADHDHAAARGHERLHERHVVAVAGDEHEQADIGALVARLDDVDRELEVRRVAVRRRGHEHGLDAVEVEQALDVARVVVERAEVRVGAAADDPVAPSRRGGAAAR